MEAMCKQIHDTLTREFKYAVVWGVSAKHSPQRVGLTHQLADEDVVQVGAGCSRLGLLLHCAARCTGACASWCRNQEAGGDSWLLYVCAVLPALCRL